MALALEDWLKRAEELLSRLTPSERTGKALIQILDESRDIARGAVVVLKAGLPFSGILLGRALFERMVLAKWVTTTESNAEEYLDLGKSEGLRQLRKLLNRGYGFMKDKRTGEDKTKMMLGDPKLKVLSRRSMENVAKQADLEDIYNIFYGFLSMPAHGSTAGLPITTKDILSLARDTATKSLQVVVRIVSEWNGRGRGLSTAEVRQILLA